MLKLPRFQQLECASNSIACLVYMYMAKSDLILYTILVNNKLCLGVDKPVHASAGPKPGKKRRVSVWCQPAVKILWKNLTMTDNQM